MAQLFPVFEIPNASTLPDETEFILKPAPLFDFERGDFVRDGAGRVLFADGRDAYAVWVDKMLHTQLGGCLCYTQHGVDGDGAMREAGREASEAAWERTISEALLAHPATYRVYGFKFDWRADSVDISFTVQPHTWPAFDAGLNVTR